MSRNWLAYTLTVLFAIRRSLFRSRYLKARPPEMVRFQLEIS